jgi:hypothetical protein
VVGAERVPEPPDALVVLHFIPGLVFQEIEAAHALLRFRRVFARRSLLACASVLSLEIVLALADYLLGS